MRYAEHRRQLARCGPPQFAQVAGSSAGRSQLAAVCAFPHRTHTGARWHWWLLCLNSWQRWHCAGSFLPHQASIRTLRIPISSSRVQMAGVVLSILSRATKKFVPGRHPLAAMILQDIWLNPRSFKAAFRSWGSLLVGSPFGTIFRSFFFQYSYFHSQRNQ